LAEDGFLAETADLEDLRKQMARITLEITRLCGERLLLAKKIGEAKFKMSIPIEDTTIEQELKTQALKICRIYSMDEDFCLKLLGLLLDESKRVQKETLRLKS